MAVGTAVSWLLLLLLCGAQPPTGANGAALGPRSSSSRGAGQQRKLLQAAAGKYWTVVPSRHISGKDIQCTPGEAFCRLCDRTVAEYAHECEANPKCEAFVVNTDTNCAYLKQGTGNTEFGAQFVTYCSSASTKCQGDFNYYPDTDLPSQGDFKCGVIENGVELPACFKAGTIQKVTSECTTSPGCKGFVVVPAENGRDPGGWLKDKVRPKLRQKQTGKDLYVKASADERGNKPTDSNKNDSSPAPDTNKMVPLPPSPPAGPNGMVEPPGTSPPSPPMGEAPSSTGANAKKGLSLGAIIGIAVGGAVGLLALLGLCIFCCLRRKKKGGQAAAGGKDTTPVPMTATAINNTLGVQRYDGPTTVRVG